MADFTNSQRAIGDQMPQNATSSPWLRLEPLITPEQLVQRFLYGIPLVSAWKMPGVAFQPQPISPEMLKDTIRRMISTLELKSKLILMPTTFKERKGFDRQEFDQFGYLHVANSPVSSVEKLAIQDPQGNDIFVMPTGWIEPGFMHRGRLYIIPLSPAQTGATFTALTGGSPWGPTIMNHMAFNGVPAYWTIEYTAGYKDGMLPTVVNELVGVLAAMEILGLLASTYARGGSHSLGIDGLSQSVSAPGAELFKIRMDELEKKKKEYTDALKSAYGKKILVSTL